MYMYRLRWCWRPSRTGRGHPLSALHRLSAPRPVSHSEPCYAPKLKSCLRHWTFLVWCVSNSKKSRHLCTSPECPADSRRQNQVALPNDHNFFRDFSMIRQYLSIRPDRKARDPTVVDLRHLKYLPSAEIHWKLGYTDNWNLQLPSRRRSHHQETTGLHQLKLLYHSPLKITFDKFKDLHSFSSKSSFQTIMRFMTISLTDQTCPVQLGEYYLSIRYYMTCLYVVR